MKKISGENYRVFHSDNSNIRLGCFASTCAQKAQIRICNIQFRICRFDCVDCFCAGILCCKRIGIVRLFNNFGLSKGFKQFDISCDFLSFHFPTKCNFGCGSHCNIFCFGLFGYVVCNRQCRYQTLQMQFRGKIGKQKRQSLHNTTKK